MDILQNAESNVIRAWCFYVERPRVLVYIPVPLFTVEFAVKYL